MRAAPRVVNQDACDRADFGWVFVHYRAPGIKVLGALRDKRLVVQILGQNDIGQPIEQCGIGPGFDGKVERRKISEFDPARIGHDQLGTVLPHGFFDLQADHRMLLGGVGANRQDGPGVRHIRDAVGHRAAAEGLHEA
jgi:hypothetical protein